MLAQRLDQRGHGGSQRQPGRAARVDPAEQRIDQAVYQLRSEPPGDQLADGDVLVDRITRKVRFGPEPGERGAR